MSLKGWVVLTVCVVTAASISVMYWDVLTNNSPTAPKEPNVLSYLRNEGFTVSTSKTDFLLEYFDAILNYEPITTTDFEEFVCYAKANQYTIYYFEKTGATLINPNDRVVYQYWTEEQASNFNDFLSDVGGQ